LQEVSPYENGKYIINIGFFKADEYFDEKRRFY